MGKISNQIERFLTERLPIHMFNTFSRLFTYFVFAIRIILQCISGSVQIQFQMSNKNFSEMRLDTRLLDFLKFRFFSCDWAKRSFW